MNTIFMNSKNRKISDLKDYYVTVQIKKTLNQVIDMLLYQILAYTIYGKI